MFCRDREEKNDDLNNTAEKHRGPCIVPPHIEQISLLSFKKVLEQNLPRNIIFSRGPGTGGVIATLIFASLV